jgi:hypothetical protein
MNVMKICLEHGQEEALSETFETFEELCSSPIPVLNPHLATFIPFMLQIVHEPRFDISTQQFACSCVTELIATRPKVLLKQQLVLPILDSALTLSLIPEADDEDDAESDGEDADNVLSQHKLGMQIVDTICQHVAAKHIHARIDEVSALSPFVFHNLFFKLFFKHFFILYYRL